MVGNTTPSFKTNVRMETFFDNGQPIHIIKWIYKDGKRDIHHIAWSYKEGKHNYVREGSMHSGTSWL